MNFLPSNDKALSYSAAVISAGITDSVTETEGIPTASAETDTKLAVDALSSAEMQYLKMVAETTDTIEETDTAEIPVVEAPSESSDVVSVIDEEVKSLPEEIVTVESLPNGVSEIETDSEGWTLYKFADLNA